MVGVIAAYVTHAPGVEYLVGAFLAGFAARLLSGRLPGMAGEAKLHAIEMFVPLHFSIAACTCRRAR